MASAWSTQLMVAEGVAMMYSPDTYVRALSFAARAHGAQLTPHGLPYVVHVAGVAAELVWALRLEPSSDEDFAVACALLHDVIEDTDVSSDVIASAFGAKVAAGVAALSKDPALDHDARIADSLQRILTQPREVGMVKLADRIVNLGPPPPLWGDDKVASYREEARQILGALGGCSPALSHRLTERIARYPGNPT